MESRSNGAIAPVTARSLLRQPPDHRSGAGRGRALVCCAHAREARVSVATTDSANVRTLTTAKDGTMCGKLLQLVQASDPVLAGSGSALTHFQSGSNYFIVGGRADRLNPRSRLTE